MIKIEIVRNHAKNICSFEISGHAGYARSGSDIVCSAVSALAQTAVIGLKMVADIDIQYKIEDRSGNLSCSLPKELNEKQQLMAHAILETMVIGLKNIEQSYKKHIDLRENEEV